jgi:small GTP-binding protein
MTTLSPIQPYPVFKYIVVGDSGIGKSSLTLRYVDDSFEEHSMPTIGIEFFVKHIEHDDKKIRLHIWDTAGQEKYRSITKSYFRSSVGCVLCFSLINRNSFCNLKDHLRDLRQGCPENAQFVLVGTFLDKANDGFRVVSREEAEKFAEDNGILYYHEVSGKTGNNVNNAYSALTELVHDNFYDDIMNNKTNKNLIVVEDVELTDGKQSGYCCWK